MKTKLHLSPFSNNHISRMFFRSTLAAAVALLLALGCVKLLAPSSSIAKAGASFSQTPGAQTCLKCPAPTQQIIYAPLIDLPEASSSEINLNCRSPHPMDVTPTFYRADGTPIVGEVIHLQPADILFLDTKSLIPAEHRKQRDWGGMSLSYTGQYMEAVAQLTLHGVNGGDSVNILFSVLNDARSNAQGAVWWMPRNGEATIALGNGSGERIHATLEFSDGESRDVNLDPFATKIVTRHANQRGGRMALNGKSESVIINSTGPEGSLIVRGVVGSADGKFTGSIRFYDTQKAVQSNLYSTRFRLKNVVPRVLLRNTTAGAIVARPRFLPESGADPVELPAMRLRPNETAEVNLAPLMAAVEERSDLDAASMQIINNGAPGSLIGALYGADKTTGMVYDVPLRDSGPVRSSTGGYPVRLDGDYSTIISITNASEVPAEFIAQVNYEGGPYLLSKHKLAAGETKTFDFRKLRDEQIPDWKGHTLPASFMRGQFRWGIHGGAANARLTGRAEILSVSERVSSSYSCDEICPPSFDYAQPLNPYTITVPVGGDAFFTAEEMDQDCYGGRIGPEPVSDCTWYSDSPDVAAAGDAGIFYGVGPGESFIHARWTSPLYDCSEGAGCFALYSNAEAFAVMTVYKITSMSPSSIHVSTGDQAQDRTISVTFDPANSAAGIVFQTTFVSNVGGTAQATLAVPANSGTTPVNTTVKASPVNSSGVFVVHPRFDFSSQPDSHQTSVIVPPQILIQMLVNEARALPDNSVRDLLGVSLKNRFGDSTYFANQNTYDAAIRAGATFDTSVANGKQPELSAAARVFSSTFDPSSGCQGFWSPTTAQWAIVNQALNNPSPTLPSGTGIPFTYNGQPQITQIVYFPIVGDNPNIPEFQPAFIFVRKRDPGQNAVVQINLP